MDQHRSVVVFGSMNMDLSIPCERVPAVGETVLGGALMMGAGGKGANQAVAAARMGARVYMIGAVGDDALGAGCVAALESAGVDAARVRRLAGCSTGAAVVVRSGGDNRIIVSPGANAVLTPRDARDAVDDLDACGAAPLGSVFITQGECALDATAEAIVSAHRKGWFTVFNPAPACDLPDDAWHEVDLVCANESECAALTGIAPSDEPSCIAALKALEAKTGGMAMLTLGAAGSAMLNEGGLLAVPADTVEVADTTAAGDAFIGCLAAARAQGFTLAEAIYRATLVATCTVTRPGAQASIPTWDEVVAWSERRADPLGDTLVDIA